MPEINISDLVPFEKQLTTIQHRKAVEDLQRDKRFHPPAKVFRLKGQPHIFVRDGHHHIRAALDLGLEAVPCDFGDAPGSVQGMIDHLEEHVALKGFAEIPIQASRTAAILADFKRDTSISLDNLKAIMDEQKRKKGESDTK